MTARLAAVEVEVVRDGRTLLRGVSLEVGGGAVTAVLGPSGAGKTSLFRVLVGEERPDRGVVRWDGHDVTRWPLWRRARAGLGYLPQGPSVLFDLTVEQNLATFAALVGERADVARQIASRVELDGRLGVRAGALSGGERRRLELARALLAKPSLLVVDEPFAGVDPAGARRIGELLRALADAGTSILLSDHHVDEALAISDRVLLLIDGAIALDTTPEGLSNDPLARSRYLAPAFERKRGERPETP